VPPPEPPPPAWTIDDAVAVFARAGVPVGPDPDDAARRLTAIIRALGWRPIGETRSGEKGGRGKALYPAQDFQDLHRDLAEWLIRIPGQTPSDR
jgi:hypothetical protein